MKLSDLQRDGELKSERDYLLRLMAIAETGGVKITIQGVSRLDLRPDMVEPVAERIRETVLQALATNGESLSSIGVTVDDFDKGDES